MSLVLPAGASWVLKHLIFGEGNEAFEGDLLEEYQRRRSRGWYWRQVIRAVLLSYAQPLSAGWAVILPLFFAFTWVFVLYAITELTAQTNLQSAFGGWLSHQRFQGIPIWILEGIAFYIAAPLATYLALKGNLRVRPFILGLVAGTVGLLFPAFFAYHPLPFLRCIYQPLDSLAISILAYAPTTHTPVSMWMPWVQALKWSPPLCVAIFATKMNISTLQHMPLDFARGLKNVLLGETNQPSGD